MWQPICAGLSAEAPCPWQEQRVNNSNANNNNSSQHKVIGAPRHWARLVPVKVLPLGGTSPGGGGCRPAESAPCDQRSRSQFSHRVSPNGSLSCSEANISSFSLL